MSYFWANGWRAGRLSTAHFSSIATNLNSFLCSDGSLRWQNCYLLLGWRQSYCEGETQAQRLSTRMDSSSFSVQTMKLGAGHPTVKKNLGSIHPHTPQPPSLAPVFLTLACVTTNCWSCPAYHIKPMCHTDISVLLCLSPCAMISIGPQSPCVGNSISYIKVWGGTA
jgi:hypothetical protein